MKPQNNHSASPYYLRSESDDISEDVAQSLQDEETEDRTTASGKLEPERIDAGSKTGKTEGKRQPEGELPAHAEEKDFTD